MHMMTDEEHKAFRKAIKEQRKKIGASKKTARAFLVRVGICDRNGKLTARYR